MAANRRFGWHSGIMNCLDAKVLRDLYVQDDIIFSDVSAGTLGITGGIDMQSTVSAIGIDMGGTFSTSAINIDGVCGDAIHISGSNTASGLHISGDQVDAILIDGDAAANNGIRILVDDGITLGAGINIDRTGTTGICTTAISIDTDGTTGLEVAAGFTGSNMISLAGTGSNAGIVISGACGKGIEITGACTTGITFTGTVTGAIDFADITLTPDATRTNYAIGIGDRNDELSILFGNAADQNFDPIQMNFNLTCTSTGPTNGSTFNGIYQNITHDTTDMEFLRIKGCDWTVTTDKVCQDAYVMQTELIIGGTKTSSGELIAVSALTTLEAGARTADRVCALQAMISGSGTAGIVVGDAFVAYLVNGGTVITTDAIAKVFNQSAATTVDGLNIENDGVITNMATFVNDGTATYLFNIDDNSADFVAGAGIGGVGANPVKIKVLVDGVPKYMIAADDWS